MYSAARNMLGAALLVGLAVLTWILGRPVAPGGVPAESPGPQDAGFYLRNATLLGTDADGRVRYRLRARRVNQPADGGALRFEDLIVEYDPSFDVHWRLSANAGVAGDPEGLLHLSEGVRLQSVDASHDAPTLIETGALTLDTSASTATTPGHVFLAHGRTRFEATGLTADLAHDLIELHADVSARLDR